MERTWRALIAEALVRSGLVGRSQIPTANQFKDGETTLVFLLDELDGKGYALPAMSTDVAFNTVSGTAKYFLGEGDEAEADPIRPIFIQTATVNIGGVSATYVPMTEISFQNYKVISIPSTQSQPFNYAINPKYPQMELYLWPTPNQVYPINLTCKVRWVDTVGDPTLNPFVDANVPPGFYNGLTDVLALKLAERYPGGRSDDSTLMNKAQTAEFMMLQYTAQQLKANVPQRAGVFPWVTGLSGVNP